MFAFYFMGQGELEGYIAADCPICGYCMIRNIGLPLLSKEDKDELLTWQLWSDYQNDYLPRGAVYYITSPYIT